MVPQQHQRPDAAAPRVSGWKKARMVVKVVELRLRFVLLMAITGLTFAYWDTLWNRYDKWARPAAEKVAAASASGVEYYCPMHPGVVRDEAGTCPICGMPLSRRRKGDDVALPEGTLARVRLTPTRVQQAGVATVDVGFAPLAETITAVGTVEYDERRIRQIASKVRGLARVERLFVNFEGKDVTAGEPLAEVYGPELYQGVRELLLAQQVARNARPNGARAAIGDPSQMLRLAREKLELMGVSAAQVDEILKKDRTDFKLPILAPVGGHVTRLNVREGQYVEEGRLMFEVVDLHRVWIKARVFEDQGGLVHVGQAVEAKVEGLPGTFAGAVEFIQPHLDPATRTVEVRFGLDNPGHLLRPGMFATVTIKSPVAEAPAFRSKLAGRKATAGGDRHIRLTAEEQKDCPVTGAKLGSMGQPVPVEVEGNRLWTCCKECPPKVKTTPAKYIARVAPPPEGEVLSVPESAVIDTGTLTMVYVEAEPGVFDGRRVTLGPRVGDRFPVLDGLEAGDEVVAAGAFLVDAESRLDPSTRREAGVEPTSSGHAHGG
jgi:Cu(I)/Ag(I) efflux system membrane fusion protein